MTEHRSDLDKKLNEIFPEGSFTEEQQEQLIKRGTESAARSWYDVDSSLATVLAVIFGPDDLGEDGTVAITLITQGATVSGTAVSRRAWEKALIEQIASSSAEAATAVAERFATQREMQAKRTDELLEHPLRRRQIRYVHFLEAAVFNGTKHVLQPTRVDLRDVSAWSLGSFEP